MALLSLILKLAFQNRVRTIATALAIAMVILGFVVLRSTASMWTGTIIARDEVMIVRNRISVFFPLFRPQVEKIRALEGVEDVAWTTVFLANYQNERNRITGFAVDAQSYFRVYPQFLLAPEQMQAWLADPSGAVVGDRLAEKHGWKIGDKVVLEGTIYPGDWEFTVRGIYTQNRPEQRRYFLFHWKYLNETVEEGRREQVGTIPIKVRDPSVGRRIDAMFASSLAETRTESEEAYKRSFLTMASRVVAVIEVVSVLVVVILILVLGNTMAMATRERTGMYAAMRAIGYRSRHIAAMIWGESFVVTALGVTVALLISPSAVAAFGQLLQQQIYWGSGLSLDWKVAGLAIAAAFAGAAMATAVPARKVGRTRIANALRRVE